MRNRDLLTTLALLAAAGLATAGCAGRASRTRTAEFPATAELGVDRAALPDTVTGLAGFQSRIFRDGRVFIGGQPDSTVLTELAGRGVTCVVNLRTPREMDDRQRVPFDEAAVLANLGIEYVHIPLGGAEHPYTPAAVDTFAAALARHPGRVLLHCTVGWRASHMWTAYLVRHRGWDLDAAYARGEAIAISEPPVARLLDRRLRLVPADE